MTNKFSLALLGTCLLTQATAQSAAPQAPLQPAVSQAQGNQASVSSVAAALERLARAGSVQAAWFTPDFAPVLPSIQGGFKGFASQYGAFQGVDDLGGGQYRLRYAGGAVTLEAAINAQGQFSKLFLKGQEGSAAPTSNPNLTPQAALERLAQESSVPGSWFTPDFAGALPSIRGGFKGFASQYGDFQGVDDLGGGQYRLRYAGGTVTLEAAINAQGQFSKLFLKGQSENVSAPVSSALTVNAALERLLKAPQPSAAWFSSDFLAAVPLNQIATLLNTVRGPLGAFQGMTTNADGSYSATFAGGTLPILAAALDAQGRFTGLRLGNAVTNQKPSLEGAIAAFRALGAQSSVAVVQGGKALGGLNPDSKLAVGSAFKLGILAELQAQIASGKHRWNEVVTLRQADKSLPSGFLQNWPVGTSLTLESLAALMISQSDNTATDTLLNLVGREGVAGRLGLGTMMSTRELFALKNPANGALLGRYLAGNAAQQRQVLAEASAAPLPGAEVFRSGKAIAPQAEWFVSASHLCALMKEVAALPLTQINPGVADPTQFKTVSYKGGSEVGVLNFTTQLSTKDGRQVCVSATLNSPSALNEQAAASAYNQILQAVR